MLDLLRGVDPRPRIVEPRWSRRIRFEPHVPQHRGHRPHWAFVDPETGEALDTAGVEALLRDITENGPKSQAIVAKLRGLLERGQDHSDD